eukprot:scaffold24017_cov118-Isochrysis_galbana.AAC.4
MGVLLGLEPDSMWPMPRGSATTLISGEHQRAKKAFSGGSGEGVLAPFGICLTLRSPREVPRRRESRSLRS